ADSIETVINRLENEPINVPRAMVQSLDMVSIQTQKRLADERVRRAEVIGELPGIDQRTGELDYASAFEWNPNTDTFVTNDSELIKEIQDERGWSRAELLEEIRNRRRFLSFLREQGVDEYRRFTALINEYYADADRVLERIERGDVTPREADTPSDPSPQQP
ncbi:MAG: type II secretion system protein, partial [Natrialbaceae archaeon]